MKRKIVVSVVQVIAMLIGLGGLFLTVIFHVMRTMSPAVYDLQRIGLAVIAAVTAAVLVAVHRWTIPVWVCAAAVLVTLAAGVVPMAVDDMERREAVRLERAQRLADDAKFAADLQVRKQDIERRIAEQRPYTPEEAREFLVTVSRSNRRSSGGNNHSAEALAMLQRALEGKLIDPNGTITSFRGGSKPEPLFISFYNEWTRSVMGRVRVDAWRATKLLAQHGADLSLPAAAEIAANLPKAETPPEFDGTMVLK